jgi:hypothetical protein
MEIRALTWPAILWYVVARSQCMAHMIRLQHVEFFSQRKEARPMNRDNIVEVVMIRERMRLPLRR